LHNQDKRSSLETVEARVNASAAEVAAAQATLAVAEATVEHREKRLAAAEAAAAEKAAEAAKKLLELESKQAVLQAAQEEIAAAREQLSDQLAEVGVSHCLCIHIGLQHPEMHQPPLALLSVFANSLCSACQGCSTGWVSDDAEAQKVFLLRFRHHKHVAGCITCNESLMCRLRLKPSLSVVLSLNCSS
jgi:hypothetical protein